MTRDFLLSAGNVLVLLSLVPWIGGIFVLGAVVAPTVFHGAPPDVAADVMTAVFRKYDRIAVLCAAALLVGEALRAVGLGAAASRSAEVVRYLLCVVLVGMTLYTAFVLSPRIDAMHRAGVVAGIGEAGARFARAHNLAEWLGKAVVLFGAAVAVLAALGAARPRVD